MKRALMCIAVVVLMCAAPTAFADVSKPELDAARGLANSGFELYSSGDYATAFERFRNAEAIYHAPPHLLYMARCKARLGELLEAQRLYERLASEQLKADEPAEFAKAQQEARAELVALVERMPKLTITVQGPDITQVQLAIDNVAVDVAAAQPIGLDPGEHRVAASADGYIAAQQTVQLREGASEAMELILTPVTTEPGPRKVAGGPSLLPPIVVMSIGGAGLLVGAITGAIALDHADELKDTCPDRTNCDASNEDLEDTARDAGTASTIAFVVGGVGAAGGLLWLLLIIGEEAPADTALQPFVDGSQIGLRVPF